MMPSERPNETRRLAAILAIDMVGYSRHLRLDEQGTLTALRTARTLAIDPAIARRAGRIFKTTGDGLLCEFSSVVAATQCALDIQHGLPVPPTADAPGHFRIGVSLGEIVVDGEDMYGDGVNLAARLQAVAQAGGVAVSRLVRDQTAGKLPARFASRGAMALKNVGEPVEVFDVISTDVADARIRDSVEGGAPPRRILRRASAAVAGVIVLAVAGLAAAVLLRPTLPANNALRAPPLIAVLPFANQSGDPAQEYFSDGITEDVINALGRFSSLSVLARNAVMPFKGRAAGIDEVVQKLGARYIVDGSVRRDGQRVRVQARLTDALGAHVLWSDRFDADASHLFHLQDELVQQIAGTLASKVGRMEQERARRKPAGNLDSYDLALRGRAFLDNTTRASHVEARRLFEAALAADPTNADAKVGLARVFHFYVQYGFTESPLETVRDAERLVRDALRHDPDHAQAYGMLGQLMTYFGRDDEALNAIDRALAINPSDAESLFSRALVLMWVGRIEEARRAFALARRLDPVMAMRPDALFGEAMVHILSGEPDRARAALEGHLDQSPRFATAYVLLAIAYAELNRPADATQAATIVRRLNPFLDLGRFGTRLRDPAHQKIVADGLGKAGLLAK